MVASDFMQVLTLMPITVVAAFLALKHPDIGGVSGFLEKLPEKNFDWSLVVRSRILWLWVVAAFIQKGMELASCWGRFVAFRER